MKERREAHTSLVRRKRRAVSGRCKAEEEKKKTHVLKKGTDDERCRRRATDAAGDRDVRCVENGSGDAR